MSAAPPHAASEQIAVEVAYACPDRQVIIPVTVPLGTTLQEAARLSGIATLFPEIDLETIPMGIFGVEVKTATTSCVQAGDRVELYRALIADPKETRRRRAQSR